MLLRVIFDSGVWADAIHDPEIYWLDNNRVIFKNSVETEKAKHYTGEFNLAVWEPGKGVMPYAEVAKSVTVCVQGDFVYYTLTDEEKNTRRFAGASGHEKPFIVPTDGSALYNEIDCRFVPDRKLATLSKEREIRLLLNHHGYLDLGPIHKWSISASGIVLYRAGSSKGVEVPIPARYVYNITYYPFKDAYLIHGVSNKTRYWWLYPDGRAEDRSLPNGSYPFPTRKGVVIEWGESDSNRDPGTLGLYLWDGKARVKLIAGKAVRPVVSPDGCKLAFAHYLYSDATLIKDPGRVTLKMINLCAGQVSAI